MCWQVAFPNCFDTLSVCANKNGTVSFEITLHFSVVPDWLLSVHWKYEQMVCAYVLNFDHDCIVCRKSRISDH